MPFNFVPLFSNIIALFTQRRSSFRVPDTLPLPQRPSDRRAGFRVFRIGCGVQRTNVSWAHSIFKKGIRPASVRTPVQNTTPTALMIVLSPAKR